MMTFRSRPGSSARRWLERTLLVGGILGLGIWAWSLANQTLYQDWSNWAFDREVAGENVSVIAYLRDKTGRTSSALSPPSIAVPIATAPLPVKGNGIIGRLEIPRLHLQAVVREGAGDATLDVALGHIPGSALPGQNGNVAVAGHRDRLFRGLRNIAPGDQIVFETLHAKFVYQVENTQIVKPEQVSVLKAGVYPELTLVTCYPFSYIGSAPGRFIVKARQVAQLPSGQPALELASATKPAPAVEVRQPAPPAAKPVDEDRVAFEIENNHSRQLTQGISIGLTHADPADKSADGWMWVMPDRRTIWLREQHTHEPLFFYQASDGRRRELVLTSVSANSVRGYLLTDDSGSSHFATGN